MVINWVSVIFGYILRNLLMPFYKFILRKTKKQDKKTKYPPKCQFGGYKNQKLLMIYFYIII